MSTNKYMTSDGAGPMDSRGYVTGHSIATARKHMGGMANHLFPRCNHLFPSSIRYSFSCIHTHLHSFEFIDLIFVHSNRIRPTTNILPHSSTFKAVGSEVRTSYAFG